MDKIQSVEKPAPKAELIDQFGLARRDELLALNNVLKTEREKGDARFDEALYRTPNGFMLLVSEDSPKGFLGLTKSEDGVLTVGELWAGDGDMGVIQDLLQAALLHAKSYGFHRLKIEIPTTSRDIEELLRHLHFRVGQDTDGTTILEKTL